MIHGIITVRTSSTRLKNKCLLPFGNEPTVIEHIIKRALFYNIEPIICTSTDSSDDILAEIANKNDIKLYRGSLNNKLKRWMDCANYFQLSSFHTVDADDPFFDGNEMIESMNILELENYDFVSPSKYSSSGGATVGYSIKSAIIKDALNGIDENADTEMMWYLLENLPKIKTYIYGDPLYLIPGSPQFRLTLDFQEDYWLLNSIARIKGNNAESNDVYDLLIKNPDFHLINHFRNSEWKKAQVDKNPYFK
jgi:spore coat polysaccharide biosynthesis protein SpsF (cytidylyltransferase family)